MNDSAILETISSTALDTVLGGAGGAPLSGDVRQDINTNWGGNQTNIGTQIINPHPTAPTTRTEWLRQHPEARNQRQIPLRPRRPWF